MYTPLYKPFYTPYHSKYYAARLTLKHPGNSMEKIASSLSGAEVDLNPHQIDAALFAHRSPLSGGVLLADEVGLGKTIEAAIVIAEYWAERKRRILPVVPASLRNQWLSELDEKFYIKSAVLESKCYNRMKRSGCANPFEMKDKGCDLLLQFRGQNGGRNSIGPMGYCCNRRGSPSAQRL